jgi:hypothetical protein
MIERVSSICGHSRMQRLRLDRLLPGRRDLLSLECLFVTFLFSGRFKLLPELSFIPFDLTVFCVILTVAA